MLALNVRSRIDQERLKLAVSEAQANYESLQQELPLMEQRHQAQWLPRCRPRRPCGSRRHHGGRRRANYFIRRLPVRISLEGSDPLLLPDLTVSADVVTSEEDSGVIVPREAVVETAGKAIVYVRQEDGGFTQREVGIGSHSNTAVTVVSGLLPGEEVSLQPPY